MSDYFGALMRSSGLRVGSASPGARRSDAAVTPRAADADIAEISVEREVGNVELREPVGLAQTPYPAASEPHSAVLRDRPFGEPHATAPHADDRVSRVPIDPEWLQRAVLDAALRWVRSDPEVERATSTSGVHAPRIAEPETPRSPETSRVVSAAPSAPAPSSAVFTRATDNLSVAEIDFESAGPQHTPAPVATERQSSRTPVEEVVEVSIGAIHVHVDGPKAAGPKPAPTPRPKQDGRGDTTRSGLDRRYLRAI